jgi:hypothetical protein
VIPRPRSGQAAAVGAADYGGFYRDRPVMIIFSLAGQVSHVDSMRDPYTDLEINCRAPLSILEACRNFNAGVRSSSPARGGVPSRCRSTRGCRTMTSNG